MFLVEMFKQVSWNQERKKKEKRWWSESTSTEFTNKFEDLLGRMGDV